MKFMKLGSKPDSFHLEGKNVMKFMKLGSKPDSFHLEGKNVRYVASELATYITVNVGDVKFYLHKQNMMLPISTACPGLDYIVVETTGAAQACVELLRIGNLGVATFMILEKQVDLSSKMKQAERTPEGVPRRFDLVKVEDE